MTPYDVISLDDAKAQLAIDYDDRNLEIQRLIATAIGLVEQHTDYRLYQRDDPEVITAIGCHTDIYLYPFAITGVQQYGLDVEYTTRIGSLYTRVFCPDQSEITITSGYTNNQDIPQALVDAAYKLIVYLADNKDMYSVSLPVDVVLLLKPYKRCPTIL